MNGGANPDRWVDRETQQFLWGWDAEEAAMKAWDGTFAFALSFAGWFVGLSVTHSLTDASIELVGNEAQVNASL